MTSIYDLSWSKTSFLAKLRLLFKSRRHEKRKMCSAIRAVQAEGYSALSSTYYGIVNTAFSQLKATVKPLWLIWLAPVRIPLWCLTWLPLAVWCYWRMLPLSNRAFQLIGYEGMNADKCDVRQSILLRRGQRDEARKCIQIALAKQPEKAHTRALLHIGLAKIYQYECSWSNVEEEVRVALAEAQIAEREDPRQAARIYRNCATITDFLNQGDLVPGNRLRRRAWELAQSVDAGDQILKAQ